MKNLILPLLLCTAHSLSAQEPPQLWIESDVSIETIFEDGFEDMTPAPFTTSGDANWNIESDIFYEGQYSASSGLLQANELSSLHLSITVPENHIGYLSFAAITSGNFNTNSYSLYLDSALELDLLSHNIWTVFQIQLEPGTHDLRWALETGANGGVAQKLGLDAVKLKIMDNYALRIQDGTEGLGKVLTSDKYGNAIWTDATTNIQLAEDDSGVKIIFPDDTSNTACIYDPLMSEGDGFFVMNALNNSFESRCAGKYGFLSNYSINHGFYSLNSGSNGFFAKYSADNGFQSESATNNGFYALFSGDKGFYAQSSNGDGFYASNSGDNGFHSFLSLSNGFFADFSVLNGFYASNSGDDGFFSENSGDCAFVAKDPIDDGFFSLVSGDDGFYSFGALDDGIYSLSSSGVEGYFSGDVTVTGNLSKGSGTFKIDHPLDPENKFLYHSFVESPDMMNVYNGNIITDSEGLATVEMPDWFEVLNKDFRYQLTVIGTFSQAIIKEKLSENQFIIQTDQPNVEVSWQITGIRQDPYAIQNPIEVEVEKPIEFKGQYLHPKAYGKPFEKGFDYIKLGKKTLEEIKTEHESHKRE